MRALLLALLALAGCDDAGPAASVDAAVIDAAPDAVADAGPDAGPADAAPVVDAASPDAGPDATGPDAAPPPVVCPDRGSPRPDGAWRVQGCGFVRDGEARRLPRAVVISADSLARDARTSLHTAVEYGDLAGAVDWVWLLVTWDGIEPRPGTYNGAYLGRICEQAAFAEAAGLDVVLALHQERLGPAFGGHGFPAWVTGPGEAVPADQPDHPAIAAAWAAFWADEAGAERLAAAWGRLLDTCADRTRIIGVHPLVDARGPAGAVSALSARVRGLAEAKWGPVLLFQDGDAAGPDVVRVASGFGPGRGPAGALAPAARGAWLAGEAEAARAAGVPLFVRGLGAEGDGLDAALGQAEALGAAYAVWHDGFGRDAYALRDEDGRPTDRWPVAFGRTWPVAVAGPLRGFEATPDGWRLRWRADGRAAGLSRVQVGPLGADPEATLEPGDLSWFTGYDVVSGELSVFVQGDAGEVELTIRSRGN